MRGPATQTARHRTVYGSPCTPNHKNTISKRACQARSLVERGEYLGDARCQKCAEVVEHGLVSLLSLSPHTKPAIRRYTRRTMHGPTQLFEEDIVRKHVRTTVFGVALSAIAAVIIVAAWAPGSVGAQQQPQGVERKTLRRQDLSMPGWEAVMIETTMQPGGTEGWHTHPGTLVEYVLQGPWTMERRGKLTATYQTGETFSIAEGEVHQAINPGKTAVRGLAILIVDKSKPMTTQVQ